MAVQGSGVFPYATASEAVEFAPSQMAELSDIQVVVFPEEGFGGDPYLNVYLFSSTNGGFNGLPGAVIEQLGIQVIAPSGPAGGIVSVASTTHPTLLADNEYWLVLTPYDANSEIGWETNGSQSVYEAFSDLSDGEGNWTAPGHAGGGNGNLQFQINSTPEPPSAWLVVPGFAVVARWRSRRSITPRH